MRIFGCAVILMLLAGPALGAATIERAIRMPAGGVDAGVVIVQFYSGGHIDRSGRGVGVFDSEGKPVPVRLLEHDVGGLTMLAAKVGNARRSFVLRYSSRPVPSVARSDVPVSLIMRTYALPQPPQPNYKQILKAISKAPPLGAALVDNISFAHNPFGRQTNFVTEFEGILRLPKSQTLRMFSVHDDMAFVEIDGRLVINRPQRFVARRPRGLAPQSITIKLDAGLHRVRYVHGQSDKQSLALLGYVQGKRALPLPGNMFVHCRTATLSVGKTDDGSAAVGFDAHQRDQMVDEATEYTRFELNAIAPAPRGQTYRWQFSDGSETTGAKAEHVFIGPAPEWGVTLQLLNASGKVVGKAQSRLRHSTFANYYNFGDERLMDAYTAAVGRCTYAQSDRNVLEALFKLLAATEQNDRMAPVAEAYLERFGRQRGEHVDQMRQILADHVAGDDPERAVGILSDLARSAVDSWTAACAAAEMIDLLIFRLDQTDRLEGEVRPAMRGFADRERSLVEARLADVHRQQGDMEKALEAYRQAQQISYRDMDPKHAAVLQRTHRETALSYLDQKRYPELRDVLFQWEADFPLAKVGGDLPLVRGRYFRQIGYDERAAMEFEGLLELNPMHPNRPEIAYRLGRCLAEMGKADEAQKWMSEVVSKYPNSPFAADAKRYLPQQ